MEINTDSVITLTVTLTLAEAKALHLHINSMENDVCETMNCPLWKISGELGKAL
jgi:hypothetical protein